MNSVFETTGGGRRAQVDGRLANLASPPIVDLTGASFPPYNIERFDREFYRIVLGVAGYAEHELEVIDDGSQLVVRGATRSLSSNGQIIRRLIEPAFERRFRLLDGFRVEEWELRNGLLLIDIARHPGVPAAVELPPRRIDEASVSRAMLAAA